MDNEPSIVIRCVFLEMKILNMRKISLLRNIKLKVNTKYRKILQRVEISLKNLCAHVVCCQYEVKGWVT